jgi:hypothetical protein
MTFPVRAQPFVTQMRRGRLPAPRCRHHQVDGPERPSGRNASPSGVTPIKHHVAGSGANPKSWTEVSPGARAHTTRTANHAHAPPAITAVQPDNPDHAPDTRSVHK